MIIISVIIIVLLIFFIGIPITFILCCKYKNSQVKYKKKYLYQMSIPEIRCFVENKHKNNRYNSC